MPHIKVEVEANENEKQWHAFDFICIHTNCIRSWNRRFPSLRVFQMDFFFSLPSFVHSARSLARSFVRSVIHFSDIFL